MSEHQTAIAEPTMAPAAVVAKSRISADAFRNLTARLKKADVTVPEMIPVVLPIAPVVEYVAEVPVVEAVEPIAVAEVVVTDIICEAAIETPELIEPAAVAFEIAAEAEPQLEGDFSENFTYVPEPGKDETPLNTADTDEALKREVAERAVELELENIWRLMLAKPTSEDRTHYLREAADYHAEDEEWTKPAPEHDLSQIEPALAEVAAPSTFAAEDDLVVLQPALLVPEGQDLAELARSLLDMMASGNASGQPQERALAADTLLRLVPRLELKPMIMLAQRLSIMDNPPHLLAARLIRDPRVEVAGPLLEDCAHLTDKDLESVVQEGEPAKLRMVARRRKLSRQISDALIKSGDPSVVLTLVRNMEAEISHDGFQSLLVLCENNEELLAPLATRPDFQAPFAFELFWLAPAQLRRYILTRFLTDSETLTKILKITMATQTEDEVEAEPLNQHALLEGLERAARGHIDIAAEELSQIMQVSVATTTRILGDLQGDAIVVMLKAAAYPRGAVSGLLKRMQDADLPLVTRERDVSELQTMFETMSFNKARILLTYWDWAQGKTGPYAPLH
jgi:uncharacterized protein (DUF2336 family)